jgi:hypothetical protein
MLTLLRPRGPRLVVTLTNGPEVMQPPPEPEGTLVTGDSALGK